MRSRDPIENGHFSCQTKIEQDPNGKVLTVELRHCNGSVAWQKSLVLAVEHASPLPAPPIPSVFTRELILSFSADTFQSGVSDELIYEPSIRVASARESTPATANISPTESQVPQLTGFQGSIRLDIQGQNVSWTLEPSEETQQSGHKSENGGVD